MNDFQMIAFCFAPALNITAAPLTVLSDISLSRGEIGTSRFAANDIVLRFANVCQQSISPLEGEMSRSDREGCHGDGQSWSIMNHKLVPSKNRANAKSMRREMTPAELKLWNAVRAGRLMDLKFRRQVPIAGYIVDFACPSTKLIVELDGSQHGNDANLKSDTKRTETFESLGWTVLRFWNDDVISNVEGVCQHIIIVAGAADAAMEKS